MQPATARAILSLLHGTSVLDPFVGAGTVLVESLRLGMKANGRDLSPLAVFVAHHHTKRPGQVYLAELKNAGRLAFDTIDSVGPVPLVQVRQAIAMTKGIPTSCLVLQLPLSYPP